MRKVKISLAALRKPRGGMKIRTNTKAGLGGAVRRMGGLEGIGG